ncbi:protein ENHANCED DISEASE RESISTANCE 2 [Cryptomeria japonica]|uniref:protein ENHANCED DISEASE RESISTANCE 2 n=1 Tax=Cryptomeria japonica TaxID=3369 RepID=UPI0027D9EB41|nr:protein ENHANCED DISEASE RESISTANCE 2 [Cryptomeria japonica]XP_057832756.2 protein ENHANCED DISEASE RESISTANCE 2 [Cryptomeria japonica]XP_057832757.2 protein ENHANCED DISEASE RESISTANCE 2 [Cryptomeria japonica]
MVVDQFCHLNVASIWRNNNSSSNTSNFNSVKNSEEDGVGFNMNKVILEGWMVRYGRRKIGRSFIHKRYFVLESRVLAYYKRKPLENEVPIKSLLIDGSCRVEDRGLETHHGHVVYVLSVYNKKDKSHRITMAAFNLQESLMWKEKIELVIDQYHGALGNGSKGYAAVEYKSNIDNERNASSSEHDSQLSAQEYECENSQSLSRSLDRRTTIGNGPPDSVLDWTREAESSSTYQNNQDQPFSRKHWRLVRCQNGLRIFEELLEADYLPQSCSRPMKAVGVVDATCEAIFELIMGMDETRYEWDCSFQYGSLVEEVDGHTAILYHRLQLDWFPTFVWPRDLCYVRYWRRNDDGSYVVLFRSREHSNCPAQPGFVRAHIDSGGFTISPLQPRKTGEPRSRVQHLMQIDLKGWGVSYFPRFQQHCLLQMLNSVAGLREWFSQRDNSLAMPHIQVMTNMRSELESSKKGRKRQQGFVQSSSPLDSMPVECDIPEEDSDEDEDFQLPDQEMDSRKLQKESKSTGVELSLSEVTRTVQEETTDALDLSCFHGTLRRDDRDAGRDCWAIPEANNFRVRSKNFSFNKSKVPAGQYLMQLVAVDWFKDVKRIDHVSRRKGGVVQVAAEKGLFTLVINLQVPGSTHYSMVFYFVIKELVQGSLLQRFVDGDDEFRNSRLKLIPSVPKGSWIVRQSVGSTPCILGKAVDCNYYRGLKYLEVDVDIGSSTVANGVLGIVLGVVTTLVVDMAFLVQGNNPEELPERLIGAVRISHLKLSSALAPWLESGAS